MFIVSDNGKRPAAFGDISYAIMDMKEHLRESGLILSLEIRHDREPTYVTLEDIYNPPDDVLSSIPYHNGAARVEAGRPLHEADTLNYPERRKTYGIGVFRTMLNLD